MTNEDELESANETLRRIEVLANDFLLANYPLHDVHSNEFEDDNVRVIRRILDRIERHFEEH